MRSYSLECGTDNIPHHPPEEGDVPSVAIKDRAKSDATSDQLMVEEYRQGLSVPVHFS